MAKKSIISVLAIMVLCFCCTICYAAGNGNSVDLGNTIVESIDKSGNSIQNVLSGNIVGSTANTVRDGIDNIGETMTDMGNMIVNDGNNMMHDDNSNNNNNGNDDGNNNDNNRNDGVGMFYDDQNGGNYNATQTTTQGTTNDSGMNAMTTTTWMWIILMVAAVIIIAAIWYYATQSNS